MEVFVVEPRFINYIDGDQDMLETKPMQRAIKNNDLAAYETDAFWRCVDSKDLEYVQNLWKPEKQNGLSNIRSFWIFGKCNCRLA